MENFLRHLKSCDQDFLSINPIVLNDILQGFKSVKTVFDDNVFQEAMLDLLS